MRRGLVEIILLLHKIILLGGCKIVADVVKIYHGSPELVG